MFEFEPCSLPGCQLIKFQKRVDERGSFTKTFSSLEKTIPGLQLTVREEYFSTSRKGVFRGLHFQLPPHALDKLVYCVAGQVTDYLVDLRKGSPTFGKWEAIELDAENPMAVFAPIGIAHGFVVRSDSAIMQYKVSETYAPQSDAGIHYNSFEFAASFKEPIVSARDQSFPMFSDFDSPFVYKP